jgi:Outer membrane protein beta-barrel domain
MKRITMIVLLTVSLLVAALVANAATCQVGVKGGVAIQKLGGDDVESDRVENRTGFVGGAYFQADFSRNLGLRVEGLYFSKGASMDTLSYQATLKLDYIEFPVLAVAHVPMSETARLDIFGGPTFGFNSKAEVAVDAGVLSGSLDVGDQVAGFEFGLTFGAGMSFDVGSAIIGFDGRYGFGLTSVVDGTPDIVSGDDVKNKGFAFMASVGIPVGSK